MRDRRFAKSSAFDPDLALRRKRESVLSTAEGIRDEDEKRDYVAAALRQNMDKVDLTSLRSRTGLQLSQSGGALATGKLDLTYDPRAGYSADREKREVAAETAAKNADIYAGKMADRAFHAEHVAASAAVHAKACAANKAANKAQKAMSTKKKQQKQARLYQQAKMEQFKAPSGQNRKLRKIMSRLSSGGVVYRSAPVPRKGRKRRPFQNLGNVGVY